MIVTREQLQTIFELGSELGLKGKLTVTQLTTADMARHPVEQIHIAILSPEGDYSQWILETNGDAAPVT